MSERPAALPKLDEQLHRLFETLRRRYRLTLGIDDVAALRQAMLAGFGISSRAQLRELCCLLWAKSLAERQVLMACFDQLELPDWNLPAERRAAPPAEPAPSPPAGAALAPSLEGSEPSPAPVESDQIAAPPKETPPEVARPAQDPVMRTQAEGSPELPAQAQDFAGASFVFVPQFAVTQREIAQIWRRLRRPERLGPPIELDIAATLASRTRQGSTSLVFVPPVRNASRVLLLVDRDGSMNPFHRISDHITEAICRSARFQEVCVAYFRNTPAQGADDAILEQIADELFPRLDQVLPLIKPLEAGFLFRDPALSAIVPTATVLQRCAERAAVVIISDGGAARGRLDIPRLIEIVGFLKALRQRAARFVWLNPLPQHYWRRGNAAQLRRHVPMFGLSRAALHQAVAVLRGKPIAIERPV